jgi:LysM repeat protein
MSAKRVFRAKTTMVMVLVLLVMALPASVHASGGVHVVQPGENLYRIALRYGTSVSAIVQANGLANANYIWVGQRLIIPGGGPGGCTGWCGGGGSFHVVQRGETLSSIARRYGTSVWALMSANGLSNPNYIWVGQRLRISGGGWSHGGGWDGGWGGGIHVVQRGETLYSIALRYGTSVQAFVAANGLRNANLIWVGQRLRIPGGGWGR